MIILFQLLPAYAPRCPCAWCIRRRRQSCQSYTEDSRALPYPPFSTHKYHWISQHWVYGLFGVALKYRDYYDYRVNSVIPNNIV